MEGNAMTDPHDPRGVLYPAKLPTFHRELAPSHLSDRVRWLWLPRWDLAPGRTSRQEILPFPASNLVVMPEGVFLSGPATGVSHRDLQGSGWAVGVLLRPGGLASLHHDPRELRDREIQIYAPTLHATVNSAMRHPDHERGRTQAILACLEWLEAHLEPPDADAQLANDMEDLISTDPEITRVDELATRMHRSSRTIQRIAERYIGLSPLTMIRRYRLQEAAGRLREHPDLTITQVAADLGYADSAHLASDFRRVLGLTPGSYRRSVPGDDLVDE